MKLVSIVVPVYNNEQYLMDCLDSIFNQSYTNLEIIVVDDGSDRLGTRDILEHCAKTEKRLHLINQPNSGVSFSRNRAISVAKGEYIVFVDSDDVLLPDAINTMVRELEASGADAVRTSYVTNRGESAFDHRSNKNPGLFTGTRKRDLTMSILSGALPAYVWLLMIKRDKIPVDARFPVVLSMMEDTYFYALLLRGIESIYLSDTVTYRYTHNDQSASRHISRTKRIIKDVIKLNGMLRRVYRGDKDMIFSMNTNHANIIANTLFLAYDKAPLRVKNILTIAEGLACSSDYRDIVDSANVNDLRPHLKYSVMSIYYNHKTRLLLIYFIRSIYKKFTGRNTL